MSGGRVTWVDMLGAAEAEVSGPGGVTSWCWPAAVLLTGVPPGSGLRSRWSGAGEAADWEVGEAERAGVDAVELG